MPLPMRPGIQRRAIRAVLLCAVLTPVVWMGVVESLRSGTALVWIDLRCGEPSLAVLDAFGRRHAVTTGVRQPIAVDVHGSWMGRRLSLRLLDTDGRPRWHRARSSEWVDGLRRVSLNCADFGSAPGDIDALP